jgi:hypothetical protein
MRTEEPFLLKSNEALIKKGSLVLVKVWPATLLCGPNGNQLAPVQIKSFTEKWQAYGYAKINHFFYELGFIAQGIDNDRGDETPISGMVLDFDDWKLEKPYATFNISRFYKVLIPDVKREVARPLWFPASDVSLLTHEFFEVNKEKKKAP